MKRFLLVIICLLLLVGCGKKVDESLSGMITIDVNPSIEIEVNDGKANRVNPLDNDAGEIVDRDKMEGKSIQDTLEAIVEKLKEKGYTNDNELTIILGVEERSSTSNDRKSFEDILREVCEKKKVKANIIVPKITEEAKHEAEGYGVTPAKAAVILENLEGNNDLHFDDLKDKSAKELIDMKEIIPPTELRDEFLNEVKYNLRGDKCEKVIKEEKAQEGRTCPDNYEEIKGKCYKIGPAGHEPTCKDNFELKDGKCVGNEEKEAIAKYTCSKGTAKTRAEAGLTGAHDGDAKDIVCVDTSSATHPVSPCELNDGTEWTKANGKCYWHRAPIIDSGCPGKVQVNGACWDDASNVLICKGARDGKQYSSRSEYCEGSVKYTKPTAGDYKCESGYKLQGDKCVKEITKEPTLTVTCSNGLKPYKDRACIDYNNVGEYITGLTCPGGARLENEKCVYYDVVDASAK